MSATEMLAGAAPRRAPDWHSINWKAVYRNVRRLQASIVKAVQEGRWNKVKSNRSVPHLALNVRASCPMVVKGLAIAGHLSNVVIHERGSRDPCNPLS